MNLIPWRNKRRYSGGEEPAERSLVRLRDDIDRAFERLLRDPWDLSVFERTMPGLRLEPRLDLTESDEQIVVKAELPGVDPKDVRIDVSGNLLTLAGEKKQEKEEKKRNEYILERSFGSFQRSVQLPSTADADRVDAKYRDGVLTITIAKHPEATPKRITVKQE